MNELKKGIEMPELFNVIKNSIGDARCSAKRLAEMFTLNNQPLRLGESESVFADLTRNIQDLECLMEFIRELNIGMKYFDGFDVPPDPVLSEDSGLKLFQEMHSALESKDWVMLSDLIEYELSPLLFREDEWLGALHEKLREYEA